MCVTSMIIQWGQEQWPLPNPGFYPYRYPTENEYDRFLDLIKKAKEYDKLNNQKDCVDESKDVWYKSLEDFMKKHYRMNT